MTEYDAHTSPEAQVIRLGLVLPEVPAPVGHFRTGRVENGFLFLSGQGPVLEDGTLATGKVGAEVTAESARHHAQRTALVLLSSARSLLGSLDHVQSVVKLLGFVNAVPDFDRHPYVIDGCSDLLRDVFGEAGEHARSAIGVGSLPGRITVEIEAIMKLRA